MAQATKSPEVVKSSTVVKNSEALKTVTVKGQEVVANLSESFINSWSEGLDRAYSAQKELEDLFLQSLDSQKENWEKFNQDLTKFEDEQKKVVANYRETTKANLSSVFGPAAGSAFEQFCSQIDTLTNHVQDIALIPYKESLNLIAQSQDQFKQAVQSNFDQQQQIREEFKNQIKSAQQLYVDFYEKNTKLVLGLLK